MTDPLKEFETEGKRKKKKSNSRWKILLLGLFIPLGGYLFSTMFAMFKKQNENDSLD